MGASNNEQSHFADPRNKGSNDLIHLDLYNIGVPLFVETAICVSKHRGFSM